MKKSLILFIILIFGPASVLAQPSTSSSGEPLKKTLRKIEERFGIELHYADELVEGYTIQGTGWMSEKSPEQSLIAVLSRHHLMFEKDNESQFVIRKFEPGRKSPEEGRAQLDYLSYRYNDRAAWEQRKEELRTCMYKALQLSPLPPNPDTEPIFTNRRSMDGYTVENIAIETLPGLFVAGSLYRPSEIEGEVPVILSPNGHFDGGRYRPDQQYRMASLARMGAIVLSYDLFGWGESQLQFDHENHRQGLAMSIQILNGIRLLDFLLDLENTDPGRVGVTGGSGGGSQTMLLTALDDRIDVSVPVVMLSSYFNGGCPCESGRPVHFCGGGTSNVEIAAMAAPRPQLVISDGNDWTADVPEISYPYLQRIYGYYGKKEAVKNFHLPDEGHDYGRSKREAMYKFMAEKLGLDLNVLKDESGNIDESGVTIEEEPGLYVFGENGKELPERAIRDFKALNQVFKRFDKD